MDFPVSHFNVYRYSRRMHSLVGKLQSFSDEKIDFSHTEHNAVLEAAIDAICSNEHILRRGYSLLLRGESIEKVLEQMQQAHYQQQQRVILALSAGDLPVNQADTQEAA